MLIEHHADGKKKISLQKISKDYAHTQSLTHTHTLSHSQKFTHTDTRTHSYSKFNHLGGRYPQGLEEVGVGEGQLDYLKGGGGDEERRW